MNVWDDEDIEEPSDDEDSEVSDDDSEPDSDNNGNLDDDDNEAPSETNQSTWFPKPLTDEQVEEQETDAEKYPPKELARLQRKALSKLYTAIDESSDKLFFIRYREQNAVEDTYRLVQADPTSSFTTAMHDYGVYRCRFWDKHLKDAETLPTTACRYWPEIRLVSPHGSLTTRTNIPPDSAKAHLRKSHGLQVWREEDINIADARLVGPFNFTLLRVPAIPNKRRATTKHNLVDSSIWTKLEAVLDEQGIDRTSIHRIVPCNFAEMLPCCSHYF